MIEDLDRFIDKIGMKMIEEMRKREEPAPSCAAPTRAIETKWTARSLQHAREQIENVGAEPE